MPEYAEAQQQLDAMSEQWQKDIERRQTEIEQLYKAYQSEQVLLTPEMRQKREEEIVAKEQELREFHRGKFGFEGALYQKRKRSEEHPYELQSLIRTSYAVFCLTNNTQNQKNQIDN